MNQHQVSMENKRNRKRKTRTQLAFDLDSILKSLEDSFIIKLSKLFKRIVNNLAKKINNTNLFINSLTVENKNDVFELKKYLENYYKKIGKATINQTNKEIQELSGKRSTIKIPDINEGLRYRTEQLAIQKLKDFQREIRDKILSSDISLKDKKAILSTLKKTHNSFVNKHVVIVSRMESVSHANNQRLEAFKKSSIVTGVQFLAVLDNRTTPICQSRHNMVIKLDDPLLPNFTPPCHFGCRSLLSPVTIYDKLEPTKFTKLLDVPNKNFSNKEFVPIETNHPNKNYKKLNQKGYKENNIYKLPLTSKEFDKILNKEIKDIIKVTNNEFERCIVLNKVGNIIFENNGGVNYVSFPSFKDKKGLDLPYYMIHNHPKSSSFSFKDFESFIKNNIPNNVVLAPKSFKGNGYYLINNIKNFEINLNDSKLLYDSSIKSYIKDNIKLLKNGKILKEELEIKAQDYSWQVLSKKYDFNYEFKIL